MRNVEYDLSREKQVSAIKEALARYENARERGQIDHAPGRGAFWDIDGRIAEVVFEGFMAKHYPDVKLENAGSTLLGAEAIIKPDYRLNGRPIDIKGTNLALKGNPHLLVNEPVKENCLYILIADIYSLKPVVIGWITGTELLKKGKYGRRWDGGEGFIYSLPHSALHDFNFKT